MYIQNMKMKDRKGDIVSCPHYAGQFIHYKRCYSEVDLYALSVTNSGQFDLYALSVTNSGQFDLYALSVTNSGQFDLYALS